MSIASRLSFSVVCCALAACSSKANPESSQVSAAGGSSSATPGGTAGSTGSVGPSGAGTGPMLNIDAGSDNDASSDDGGSGAHIITSLPAGYVQTDMGGLLLGASLSAGGAGSSDPSSGGASGNGGAGGSATSNGNCGNILTGVVRDFRGANDPGGHPDFEASFWGNDVTPNLVAAMLGSDQKPVYASKCELGAAQSATCPFGPETTNKTNFDEWYRDTPNMNLPFVISLYLAPQPGGLFTFQSLHYFPLDNAGYGNSGTADDGMLHNFSFTTEIHTQFSYNGGETFTFQGDDDVWVFINGKLAVDLGGLHPRILGTVALDDAAAMLGLQKGSVYPLDLFHAERHTDKSTFRIDTNLSFVNCGTVETGPK